MQSQHTIINVLNSRIKAPCQRNDIVDVSSTTLAFNVAKIASSARIVTKSSTISLRVAWPLGNVLYLTMQDIYRAVYKLDIINHLAIT